MFCYMNFMYRLYHDCARTLKRSLLGKLAIVELSGDFGFARNSSKHPCTLASFSRARMPCSVCTRDVTCGLYCMIKYNLPFLIVYLGGGKPFLTLHFILANDYVPMPIIVNLYTIMCM